MEGAQGNEVGTVPWQVQWPEQSPVGKGGSLPKGAIREKTRDGLRIFKPR